jgi:1,2-diacylglycerol 3-beta-glucosyltransferase
MLDGRALRSAGTLLAVSAAVTALSWVGLGLVLYYLTWFALSLFAERRRVPVGEGATGVRFVVVVPAHDEELVIGATVERLKRLRGDVLVLLMDDGSRDRTAEVARAAIGDDPRFVLVHRDPSIAGRGKGEVLNHAFRLVSGFVAAGDPRLGATDPADVVIGVIDADGWLDEQALEAVGPYFATGADVGGVQLPVRMFNAGDGLLARMQDIEFLGFCRLMQAGRDPIGSVGLGGNGQFVRLSALQQLGAAPWSKCLTEDLDLTMALIRRGWRLRFCPDASVAQQALTDVRPFLRQRGRWVQGHYSCWRHVPGVLGARGVPLVRRLDAAFYLLAIVFAVVFFLLAIGSLAAGLGLIAPPRDPWSYAGDGWVHLALVAVATLAPIACVAFTYKRAAPGASLLRLPGTFAAYTVYGYAWAMPATGRALWRLLRRRDGWAKTPRVPLTPEVLAAEAAVSS